MGESSTPRFAASLYAWRYGHFFLSKNSEKSVWQSLQVLPESIASACSAMMVTATDASSKDAFRFFRHRLRRTEVSKEQPCQVFADEQVSDTRLLFDLVFQDDGDRQTRSLCLLHTLILLGETTILRISIKDFFDHFPLTWGVGSCPPQSIVEGVRE